MLYSILSIILVFLVSFFTMVGLLMLGEHFSDKFDGSKFSKWWDRNVITKMHDRYED